MTADPLSGAAAAFAASTQADTDEVSCMYLALAKMLTLEASEKVARLTMMIKARETELARVMALRAKGLTP